MLGTTEQVNNSSHKVERKIASVFASEKDLQNAVAELQTSGIPRRNISVIADSETVKAAAQLYDKDAAEVLEYSDVSVDAAITFEELAIARGAIFNVSVIVGVAVTALMSMGMSSVLAHVAVSLLGGVAGAGVGYLIAKKMQKKYLMHLKRQLEAGGYVLWVAIPSKAKQLSALMVLNRNGAEKIKAIA